MATRRSANLAIAFSPTFKRQTTRGTPLDASELTRAFPATSRNYINTDETVEEIYDCTDEDLLIELVTGRIASLTIDADVDANILAGMLGFAYGVAASPSGGTAELQRLTISGSPTGGNYKLRFTVDYDTQETATIAYNANAAAIQSALLALSNIGASDLTVAVASGGSDGVGPYDITFAANLNYRDLSMLEPISVALTGGTSPSVAVTEVTPGAGRSHAISRLGVGVYTLPCTTLYVGFRGSDKQPVIFEGVCVNNARVRGRFREKLTMSFELLGSANLQSAVGFTMPDCENIEPLRFSDLVYTLGNTNQSSLLREAEYYYSNEILRGDHPFTGSGIDIDRLERANRRVSYINATLLGEPDDTLYNQAKARTILQSSLRIGPASQNVLCNQPSSIFKFAQQPPIDFQGEANESVILTQNRPKKIKGDSTTPSNIVATTRQASAYLVAA